MQRTKPSTHAHTSPVDSAHARARARVALLSALQRSPTWAAVGSATSSASAAATLAQAFAHEGSGFVCAWCSVAACLLVAVLVAAVAPCALAQQATPGQTQSTHSTKHTREEHSNTGDGNDMDCPQSGTEPCSCTHSRIRRLMRCCVHAPCAAACAVCVCVQAVSPSTAPRCCR